MNVIDLRDELYKRQIEIIEINEDCIYYDEELSVDGEARIYIYCYDLADEQERVLAFFALGGSGFERRFYPCGDSIIMLFENGTDSAWVIRTDKQTGAETLRRKISLIGKFSDCVVIDGSSIVIYTTEDDENRELFLRCKKATNSDTIANMYDLERGWRYFIKDFKTAALLRNCMQRFRSANGDDKLLLCDPYCGESEKEELVRALSKQFSAVGDELRDNIWIISQNKLLDAIRSRTENISLRRIASAGLEGTVRFECISGSSVIFRAKLYKTQLEQFFEMSTESGKVKPLREVRERNGDAAYFTDNENGEVYYLTRSGGRIRLEGEIGSSADITYPEKIGEIESCVDGRYIIAEKPSDEPTTAIYDSRLHITDTFQAKARVKGETVVLY